MHCYQAFIIACAPRFKLQVLPLGSPLFKTVGLVLWTWTWVRLCLILYSTVPNNTPAIKFPSCAPVVPRLQPLSSRLPPGLSVKMLHRTEEKIGPRERRPILFHEQPGCSFALTLSSAIPAHHHTPSKPLPHCGSLNAPCHGHPSVPYSTGPAILLLVRLTMVSRASSSLWTNSRARASEPLPFVRRIN